jgi:hypothetical protein
VNWLVALKAVAYDFIFVIHPFARQPLLRGDGDFFVEGTTTTVQENMALSHDFSPQLNNELAAEIRILRHLL